MSNLPMTGRSKLEVEERPQIHGRRPKIQHLFLNAMFRVGIVMGTPRGEEAVA